MKSRTLVALSAAALIGAFAFTPASAQDAMGSSGQAMSHDATHMAAMHEGCTGPDDGAMHHDSTNHPSMQHDAMGQSTPKSSMRANCTTQKDGMRHDGMMKAHDSMKMKESAGAPTGSGG